MSNNSTAEQRLLDQAALLPLQAPGDINDALNGPITYSIHAVSILLQLSALFTSMKRLVERFHRVRHSASFRGRSLFAILKVCLFDIGLVVFINCLTLAMIFQILMTHSLTTNPLGSRILRLFNTLLSLWVADPQNRSVYGEFLVAHTQIGYELQTFSSFSLLFSALGSYLYAILLLERFKNIRTIMPYPTWYNLAMLVTATLLVLLSAGSAIAKIILHRLVQNLIDSNNRQYDSDILWENRDIVSLAVTLSRLGISSRSYAVFAVYIVGLDGILSMIFYVKLKSWQKYREFLGFRSQSFNVTGKSTFDSVEDSARNSRIGNENSHNLLSIHKNNISLLPAVQRHTSQLTSQDTSDFNTDTGQMSFKPSKSKKKRISVKKMFLKTTFAIWTVFSLSLLGVFVFLGQSIFANPDWINIGFILNAVSFFTIALHTNASYLYLECIKRIFKIVSS